MNSITIDGVVIPVVKNRPQFGTGRAKARVFVHSVVEAEEELLGKISKRSFIPELCNAYLYLKHTFNTEEITYDMVRPLAHFFAHYLNFQLTREYYRRRKTLIYWTDGRQNPGFHFGTAPLYGRRRGLMLFVNSLSVLPWR